MITNRIVGPIINAVRYAAGWGPLVLVWLATGYVVSQLVGKIHGPVHQALSVVFAFAFAAWLLTSLLALVAGTGLRVRHRPRRPWRTRDH